MKGDAPYGLLNQRSHLRPSATGYSLEIRCYSVIAVAATTFSVVSNDAVIADDPWLSPLN